MSNGNGWNFVGKRVSEMIVGVGNDIIEIERVRKLLSQSLGVKFLERILTSPERALAEQRAGRLAQFVAGRFAAKEAVAKALGCGIGEKVGFQDISITPNDAGKPECELSADAMARLGLHSQSTILISISHSDHYATAVAIVTNESV